MAHFADISLPAKLSAGWPPNFGTVSSLSTTISAVLFGAVGDSPKTGATEGTDQHTYTVVTGETGLYLVLTHLHTDVLSDAGTSQTVATQVAYNDGAAQAAALLGGDDGGGSLTTVTQADTTTVDTHAQQMGIIRAEAGTDIVVSTLATNGGTVATTGTIDFDVAILRLA
jgi:hypothetical protein